MLKCYQIPVDKDPMKFKQILDVVVFHDTRSFGDLQMKYRLETEGGEVLGWTRYVNRGTDRWMLFWADGKMAVNRDGSAFKQRSLSALTLNLLH